MKGPKPLPLYNSSPLVQLFMQISIICLLTVFSCLGYAYESFFEDYKWLLTATADVYIFYLGSPAFVYLLLNKSIRNEAIHFLQRISCNHYLCSSAVVPSTGETHVGCGDED